MEGWVGKGDEKCLGEGVEKTERFAVIDCSIVLTLAKFDWLKDQRTLQQISGNIHNSSMIGRSSQPATATALILYPARAAHFCALTKRSPGFSLNVLYRRILFWNYVLYNSI